MHWNVLGAVGLVDDDGVWRRIGGMQPQALLVLLIVSRNRFVPQVDVGRLLWGDDLPAHWAGAVRGVVAKLRSGLVAAGLGPETITSERAMIRLNLPASATIDLDQAVDGLHAAEAHLQAHRWDQALAAAGNPAAIDPEHLLAGLDTSWVRSERQRLRSLARQAGLAMGEAGIATGRPGVAVDAAEKLIEADAFDEAAHRMLIRAHVTAGERKAALDVYEGLRQRLDEELGVRPATETEQLHLHTLGEAPAAATVSSGRAWNERPLPNPGSEVFVGRVDELSALSATWADVEATGRSSAIVVEAEAGGGKSRLALEFVDVLTRTGGAVLWGGCRSAGGTAYEPFVEALDRALSEQPDVAAGLGPIATDLALLLPKLQPGAESPATTYSSDPLARGRLFRAVADAFSRLVTGPTLFVLDDLQWSDADTRALLLYLATDLVHEPVLLLILMRERTRALAATLVEVGRDMPLEIHKLEGFEQPDVVELVRAAGYAAPDGSKALAEALLARTGGNPFYISQLLRSASDRSGNVDPLAIPARLRDWIRQQVRALAPAEAGVLSLASVIGQEIDFETLAACSSVPRLDLLTACEELTGARLLVERAAVGQFGFAHALVCDAVYDDLGPTRLALLHERVADALATRPGASGRLAQLAHHLAKAGPDQTDRAQVASLAAGAEALEQASWERAVEHLQRAAQLASGGPEVRAEALVLLGRALRGASRDNEAREAFEAAVDLAEDHELPRPRAVAVLGLVGGGGRGVAVDLPDDLRASLLRRALEGLDDRGADAAVASEVLGELALALLLTERVAERDELARRSLLLGRLAGDDTTMARALLVARLSHVGPEHAETRLSETAELLALRGAAPDARLAALVQRHDDLLVTGDRGSALEVLAEAEEVLERYDHPYWRWALTTWRGLSAVIDGELDRAEALATEAVGLRLDHPEAIACFGVNLVNIRLHQGRAGEMVDLLATAANDNPHIPAYRAVLALCCAEAGLHDQAEKELRYFANHQFSTIPYDTNRLLALAVLADVAATLESREPAERLTALLRPHAKRQVILNCFGGGGATWGPVELQLGRLAGLVGDPQSADRWFDEAMVSAESFGSPPAAQRVAACRDRERRRT